MISLCAVIDVGKTNVKIQVVDREMRCKFQRNRVNRVIRQGIYPHYDIEALWQWVRGTLSDIASDYPIDAIAITTHGATAALVHPGAGESGLVLPVMDYEFEGVAADTDYSKVRPPFSETFSPALPAGLNLGRQLFWQQRYCERAFGNARYILSYPQYWVWRFTGIAISEVTSWGCHTDLWAPAMRRYSSLVAKLNIENRLPPLLSAGEVVGTIKKEVADQTGLSAECKVYAGVHDSNASYSRYLGWDGSRPFTVVSTGTWVVSFSSGANLNRLDERRDMLANVDINGVPVVCARFMGGREFEAICLRTGSKPEHRFSLADMQKVVDDDLMALPDFSEGSGPLGGRPPEIRGRATNGAALATVYCALMLDYQLDLLGSRDDLILEGSWLRNPLLCGLVAQLRSGQYVGLSTDETGTVNGMAQLVFGSRDSGSALIDAVPIALSGLESYRDRWRRLLGI